jgi:hypothetical protein
LEGEQHNRLPLNLNNTQDISLFKEALSTKNFSEEPRCFSPPATFMMPCVSDITTSAPDASRKRKQQFEGAIQQNMSKKQVEQDDQAKLWKIKFAELLEVKQQKGHCCVPHNFKKDALASCVKRQRYQYKLKIEGKQSTMTDEVVVELEARGFIWDYNSTAPWQERWNELVEYKGLFGN